jgi:Cof subfamily protein (haloacid dehalogenase superfamily)
MHFRLLALDADGSLLDPEGQLRPRVREAVAEARRRSCEVVLCTGRRHRTARGILEALDLDGPAVVQNGVRVVDGPSGRTLRGRYLPEDLYPAVIEVVRRFGPPLVYIDSPQRDIDIVVDDAGGGHPFQQDYVASNLEVIREVDSLESKPAEPVVMVSCMADSKTLDGLEAAARRELGERIDTHHIHNKMYDGHILEVLSAKANKWNAVRGVAEELGIAPAEIFALGDDENDLPMIQGAGLGVAMANAKPAVRDAADFVTASNAEDGAAQAIERFVLGA